MIRLNFAFVHGVGGARSILSRRALARSISDCDMRKFGFAMLHAKIKKGVRSRSIEARKKMKK